MEDHKRLELLESNFNSLNIGVETIKLTQEYLKQQTGIMMVKLDAVNNSLGDPGASALGRSLTQQINGYAVRFEKILEDQQKDIIELNKFSNELKGALGLMKFVGFSALASGVGALVLIFLQILNVIKG